MGQVAEDKLIQWLISQGGSLHKINTGIIHAFKRCIIDYFSNFQEPQLRPQPLRQLQLAQKDSASLMKWTIMTWEDCKVIYFIKEDENKKILPYEAASRAGAA